jgi:hypothetical protein
MVPEFYLSPVPALACLGDLYLYYGLIVDYYYSFLSIATDFYRLLSN